MSDLSDADNEFLLGVYRNAVAFYQPKIEKRTGILLGTIRVMDYKHLAQNVVYELEWRDSPWPLGLLRRFLYRSTIRNNAERMRAALVDHADGCSARYYKNAIYISFTGKRRHEELLALIAVHELSHALWEKIEGRPIHRIWFKSKTEHDKFALFAEGFAVFAHETWFLDIYPPSVKQMIAQMGWANTDGFHYRGRQRIQELVKQYGPEVFLEIPKRWRSL